MLHKLLMMAVLGLGLWGSVLAHAQQQGDVAAAANAFAQAQRAELNGQHARAAELYELADRVVPAPEALRNATRAWLAAGRHVSAATSAEELLRRYGQDATSRELAEEVLSRTQPVLGRWAITCSEPCTISVSGLATGTNPRTQHVVYVEPGPHTLTARFAHGDERTLRVETRAGDSQSAAFEPEPPPKVVEPAQPEPEPRTEELAEASTAMAESSPDETRSAGLSPVYFWVGLSTTLAVGAVTVWSGIDLLNARDDFEANDAPTRKAFEVGENKDLRTSILIGSTAALAAGTAILAFFTEFGGRSREQAAQRSMRAALPIGVSADRQGGHVLLRGAF